MAGVLDRRCGSNEMVIASCQRGSLEKVEEDLVEVASDSAFGTDLEFLASFRIAETANWTLFRQPWTTLQIDFARPHIITPRGWYAT